MKLLIIGIGGFLGAILRYSISGWIHKLFGSGMPYGTLAVNILGSFILGFFLFYSEDRQSFSPLWRSFIAVGIIGALTTFSTFSYETFALLQESLFSRAILNISMNLFLTLVAVWSGMSLARFF